MQDWYQDWYDFCGSIIALDYPRDLGDLVVSYVRPERGPVLTSPTSTAWPFTNTLQLLL